MRSFKIERRETIFFNNMSVFIYKLYFLYGVIYMECPESDKN